MADVPCGHGRARCVVSVVDVAAALVPGDTRLQLLVVDRPVLRAPGVAAWWAQGAGLGPAQRMHIHPVHLTLPTLPAPQGLFSRTPSGKGGLDHAPATALALTPGQRDSQGPPSLLGGQPLRPPQMVL